MHALDPVGHVNVQSGSANAPSGAAGHAGQPVAANAQPPLQGIHPDSQPDVHCPPTHAPTSPLPLGPQAVVQSPHPWGSFARFRHVLPQGVAPAGHDGTHAPLEQNIDPQSTPQPPQLLPDVRSASQPFFGFPSQSANPSSHPV